MLHKSFIVPTKQNINLLVKKGNHILILIDLQNLANLIASFFFWSRLVQFKFNSIVHLFEAHFNPYTLVTRLIAVVKWYLAKLQRIKNNFILQNLSLIFMNDKIGCEQTRLHQPLSNNDAEFIPQTRMLAHVYPF